MKIKGLMVAFLLYLGVSLGGMSFGTPIYSNPGLEGLGSFSGSVDYSYTDDTHGQLIIELTNTSPRENLGYITALAFQLLGEHSMEVSGFDGDDEDFYKLDSVSTPPLKGYDAGAALGTSWLGSSGKNASDPADGIGVNQTAKFYFDLTGTGLSSLGANSFASNKDFLAIRFRGFADGGSDKVTGGGGGAQVPEPATVLLLGSGLLGLFGCRKKFWKSKQNTKE